MVAKVINVNSMSCLGPMLNYISAVGHEEKEGALVGVNGMTEYAAEHLNVMYREFQASINEKCRHKMKHLIVSHHPLDSERILKDPQLEQSILKSFEEKLREKGVDLSQFKYAVFRHVDKAHVHYHWAICNTDENGYQMKDLSIGLKMVKSAKEVNQEFDLETPIPKHVQNKMAEAIQKAPVNADGSRDFDIGKRHYHITEDWKISVEYKGTKKPMRHLDYSNLREELLARGAMERELRYMEWYKMALGQRAIYSCQNLAFSMIPIGNDLPNIKLGSLCFTMLEVGIKMMILMGQKEQIKNDLRALNKRPDRIPEYDLYDRANQGERLDNEALDSTSNSKVVDISNADKYDIEIERLMNDMRSRQSKLGHRIEETAESTRKKEKDNRRAESVRKAKKERIKTQHDLVEKHFMEYWDFRIGNSGQVTTVNALQVWLRANSETLFGEELHLYGNAQGTKLHIQDASNNTWYTLPDSFVEQMKERDSMFLENLGSFTKAAEKVRPKDDILEL